MHPAISAKRDQIISACKRVDIARLDVFGSAARGAEFDPDRSDADFLVAFRDNCETDPYLDLEVALETILGRKVDLMDRRAIETSRNYIRRRAILEQAELIFLVDENRDSGELSDGEILSAKIRIVEFDAEEAGVALVRSSRHRASNGAAFAELAC